jgi:hypothetical protein
MLTYPISLTMIVRIDKPFTPARDNSPRRDADLRRGSRSFLGATLMQGSAADG